MALVDLRLGHKMRHTGRVEMWRGGVGAAYLFTDPFVCRCLTSLTLLRFHIPLIEPDRRSYRIRLSEKAHVVAHGRLAVRATSRTRPNSSCKRSSGYRRVPTPRNLCLAHSH
jgi:hypothetical protein